MKDNAVGKTECLAHAPGQIHHSNYETTQDALKCGSAQQLVITSRIFRASTYLGEAGALKVVAIGKLGVADARLYRISLPLGGDFVWYRTSHIDIQ